MADERAGAILWQGKWLIAVSLVFSIAVGVLATELQSKVYEASALVRAAAPGHGSVTLARTDAALIDDPGFLGKIRRQVLAGRYTADELADSVRARPVADTALVRVTAEESSPALALALARDVAAAVVGSTQGLTLAAPASANRSAIRPNGFQNVLAGIALGLLIGVALSWLRVRLDRALHGADEVEELAAAPLLATIPLRKRHRPDDPLLVDAFDALFARLAGCGLGQQTQVLAITSSGPGEGRTATAAGLAYAAVRAGARVLLVDCDVRNAALSARFGTREQPGLTNVVVGDAWLHEAVLEVEPGLLVLPAGLAPTGPNALVASGPTREILAELREGHSLIAVDAPALADGPEAAALAAMCDAALLVARVDVTRRAELAAAAAALRGTGTPLLGIAVYRPQDRAGVVRTAPEDPAPAYDRLVRH